MLNGEIHVIAFLEVDVVGDIDGGVDVGDGNAGVGVGIGGTLDGLGFVLGDFPHGNHDLTALRTSEMEGEVTVDAIRTFVGELVRGHLAVEIVVGVVDDVIKSHQSSDGGDLVGGDLVPDGQRTQVGQEACFQDGCVKCGSSYGREG